MSISLSIKLITVSLIALQIEYKHQLIGTRNTFNQYYDYIVVGAGSAGCAVAHRLAEIPDIKVLLLEVGKPQSAVTDIPAMYNELTGSDYDWNYTTVPQNNYGLAKKGIIAETRGKAIGGTTVLNGMQYNRGNRRGFDEWETEFGANGWRYEEVLKYFIKSENNSDLRLVARNPGFHGIKGPVHISSDPNPPKLLLWNMKAFNEWGLQTVDINGAKQLGTTIMQDFIDERTGFRASAANAYIDPNPYPNKLHILTNAFVVRVLLSESDEGLKAIGVQFIRDNKLHEVRAKEEVIISAGVFNSPQLLMLSGIGPKDHLKSLGIEVVANLPVGHHLQDQAGCIIHTVIKDKVPLDPFPQLNVEQLYQLYTNHSGPLAHFTDGFTFYNTKSNPNKDWPNAGLINGINRITRAIYSSGPSRYTVRTQEWAQYFRPYIGKNDLQFIVGLTRVRSEGTVRLALNNPYIYPLIDPRFLSDPRDREDLIDAIKLMFRFIKTSSVSKYVYLIPGPIPGCHLCPDREIYECDQYIDCFISQVGVAWLHPVGTCRMGSIERSDVVVSPRLKVKGIGCMRVCDASVMPRIPNSNTNAATIMIGEKCSDFAKQDYILKHKLN